MWVNVVLSRMQSSKMTSDPKEQLVKEEPDILQLMKESGCSNLIASSDNPLKLLCLKEIACVDRHSVLKYNSELQLHNKRLFLV